MSIIANCKTPFCNIYRSKQAMQQKQHTWQHPSKQTFVHRSVFVVRWVLFPTVAFERIPASGCFAIDGCSGAGGTRSSMTSSLGGSLFVASAGIVMMLLVVVDEVGDLNKALHRRFHLQFAVPWLLFEFGRRGRLSH